MNSLMNGTCAFFVAICIASSSFAGDWPEYHGPNRDRVSSETAWMTEWEGEGPKILWRERLGVGYGSFAVVGERVYVAGYDKDMGEDVIYCFDVTSGDEVWTFSYPCAIYDNLHDGGPTATPTLHEGHLYIMSKEGHVHCLNAETGEKVWMVDVKEALDAEIPTWGFACSPLIVGDTVVVDAGVIAAMDKKTGELAWKTEENYGSAYSAPVLAELNGKTRIVAFPAYGVVILEAESGEFVSSYPWETSYGVNAATPIVHKNYIQIGTGYNKGSALLGLNESDELVSIWESKVLRTQMNAAVLYEGKLYGFDESDLVCIDFMTAEEHWRYRDLGKGSLMIADGHLIALGDQGELVVAPATPDEFAPTGRIQILGRTCWTCPVLSNGTLFARNSRGDMVALDMSGS